MIDGEFIDFLGVCFDSSNEFFGEDVVQHKFTVTLLTCSDEDVLVHQQLVRESEAVLHFHFVALDQFVLEDSVEHHFVVDRETHSQFTAVK